GTTPISVAFGRCTTTPVAVAICAFGSKALSAGVLGSFDGRSWLSLLPLSGVHTLPVFSSRNCACAKADAVTAIATTLHTSVAARLRKVVMIPSLPDYMQRYTC